MNRSDASSGVCSYHYSKLGLRGNACVEDSDNLTGATTPNCLKAIRKVGLEQILRPA
jgi:hypothetical protein